MKLINKNIVLFGASQGIGKCLAKELSKRGNKLVLLSKNINQLKEVQSDLIKNNDNININYCDVTKKENVLDGINYTLSKLRSIDLAIYNSGVGWPEPFINFNSDNIKGVFDVNLYGLSHFLEAIIPIMKKQGHGIIAGVSSLADGRGYPGSASYCSSKAAASKFLESARVELRSHNIKVITIKPGFVKTAMTDRNKFYMPFLMPPEKAAKIIVNKLIKEKRIVQFPIGTVLLIKLVNHMPNFIYDRIIVATKDKATI